MNKINTLALTAITATSLLLGCVAHLTPRTHTDRTGVILVEEPEVFTRERLVQDRREQAKWLEAQLKKSYGDIDFGYQGISDVRRSRAIGFSTAVDLEPGGYTRTEEETQLESSEIQALGGAAELGLPDATLPAESKAKSSPIDTFRDALAYRDVIRNELLESQLDDRFDVHSNTLYLLNFDATVFPTHDTSSYAVIRVAVSAGPLNDDANEKEKTYIAWLNWWRGRLENELTNDLFGVDRAFDNLQIGVAIESIALAALERSSDYAARHLGSGACLGSQELSRETTLRELTRGWFQQTKE